MSTTNKTMLVLSRNFPKVLGASLGAFMLLGLAISFFWSEGKDHGQILRNSRSLLQRALHHNITNGTIANHTTSTNVTGMADEICTFFPPLGKGGNPHCIAYDLPDLCGIVNGAGEVGCVISGNTRRDDKKIKTKCSIYMNQKTITSDSTCRMNVFSTCVTTLRTCCPVQTECTMRNIKVSPRPISAFPPAPVLDRLETAFESFVVVPLEKTLGLYPQLETEAAEETSDTSYALEEGDEDVDVDMDIDEEEDGEDEDSEEEGEDEDEED